MKDNNFLQPTGKSRRLRKALGGNMILFCEANCMYQKHNVCISSVIQHVGVMKISNNGMCKRFMPPSQQAVEGGQAKKGSFEIFHDNNPWHTNECAGYR